MKTRKGGAVGSGVGYHRGILLNLMKFCVDWMFVGASLELVEWMNE